MKIGLIADIHGNSPAFNVVLSLLRDRVDLILFFGDFVGYYPFVNECAEMWDQEAIIGIRGNHDEVLRGCIKHRKVPPASYRIHYGSALERS